MQIAPLLKTGIIFMGWHHEGTWFLTADISYIQINFFVLLGNPDFDAWQKYFFRVSEGTMQISFIDLKNLVEDTNYEKVHLYSSINFHSTMIKLKNEFQTKLNVFGMLSSVLVDDHVQFLVLNVMIFVLILLH